MFRNKLLSREAFRCVNHDGSPRICWWTRRGDQVKVACKLEQKMIRITVADQRTRRGVDGREPTRSNQADMTNSDTLLRHRDPGWNR